MKALALKYYVWIPVLFLCIFYTLRAIHFPAHDFSNYYFGGCFLSQGNFTPAIYFPYEFNKAIAETGHLGIFANYAPNTPFLALLFYPFSCISLVAAKIVFNVISIFLFIYSLKRLVSFYQIDSRYLLLIPVLFFTPIKNELLFGQVYFLLFFLVSESAIAYKKNQIKRMAVFFSIAIFLKVFPLLLVFIFVFKKEFRALLYVGICCVTLFLISTWFTGYTIWIFYLENVLPKASNGEIASAFVSNYQSVFMFLKQLLVYDNTENTNAWLNSPILFSALMVAFKVLLITAGFYVSKRNQNSLLVFGYWIFAGILISPYGSTYTFILMIFIFLAFIKSEIPGSGKAIMISLLFFLNNLPLSLFITSPFPFSYIRFFILLLLFVVLLFAAYKNVNWKTVTIITTIPILLIILFKSPQRRERGFAVNTNSPILIYDYKLANDTLTYFYWNENGAQSHSLPLKFSLSENLTVKDNQIFYRNQFITTDNSNKLKPIVIDNHMIIYLSDFDRGIGFYTLKQIDFD